MSKKERMARRREALREMAESIADNRDAAVLSDLARARRHTYRAEGTALEGPAVALRRAVDAFAEVLTGDPKYLWAKSPDLCQGYRKPPT